MNRAELNLSDQISLVGSTRPPTKMALSFSSYATLGMSGSHINSCGRIPSRIEVEMVYLITGPVGSGKTTRLLKWIEDNVENQAIHCVGITAPVRDGHRYLRRIPDGEERLINAVTGVPDEYLVKIGHHIFDQRIFQWGRGHLQKALESFLDDDSSDLQRLLVIDEIGPLELTSRGFDRTVLNIFKQYAESTNFDLLIVVRDYLVDDVIDAYGLNPRDVSTDLP